MDPNAALREIKELLAQHEEVGGSNMTSDDQDRFFDLVEGLDQWMSRGGFLPKAWKEGR